MQLTDRQLSDKEYQSLCDEYTEDEMKRWIGSAADYYKIVWQEAGASEFRNWLRQPEPDWQCDC